MVAKVILQLFSTKIHTYPTRIVFRSLEDILNNGQWQSKAGVLDALKSFVVPARDHVTAELGNVLPKVEPAMHDTEKEVSSAAVKCATSLCTTVANSDLAPHIPVLVKCMSDSDSVPACIKALSSTTFVAEVTSPALAVLVPLLIRALNDRSMEVQRRTVVVIDNLVKLVCDPNVAATYLSPLVDGVSKIAKGAAFPEVRAFGEAALSILQKSGASSSGLPPTRRNIESEMADAFSALVTLLPSDLLIISPATPNGPHTPNHPLLVKPLEFQASLVADTCP